MNRLKVVALLLVAALVAAGGAIAWRLRPQRIDLLTDADTIRVSRDTATVREVLWRPPTPLPATIDTAADEYEPAVSADGRELFFVRGKPGGGADLYVAVRNATGWDTPRPIAAVNSSADEMGPCLSPDGQWLYFYSDRPGGAGGYDLWRARRTPRGWDTPVNLGLAVNSEFNDYGPAVSPDGRRLCFASNRPRPAESLPTTRDAWPATLREEFFRHDYDLYESAISDSGFRPPAPLAALNSPANDGAPAFSPAGDFLYFASDRPGGAGGFDLYRARLAALGFDPPRNLGPQVNTAANELDPALDLDGFGLHFSSNRAAAHGATHYDLFRTTSREVFRAVESRRAEIDWAGLWARIRPHAMWGLLALLILALLAALLRDFRERRLSLLARCLLASLMVHAVLMFLFSAVQVTSAVADFIRRPGAIRVALGQAGRSASFASQIRGSWVSAPLPAPRTPQMVQRPVAAVLPVAAAPQAISLAPAPALAADRPLTRAASADAALTAPTATIAAATPVSAAPALPPPAESPPVATADPPAASAAPALPAAPPRAALPVAALNDAAAPPPIATLAPAARDRDRSADAPFAGSAPLTVADADPPPGAASPAATSQPAAVPALTAPLGDSIAALESPPGSATNTDDSHAGPVATAPAAATTADAAARDVRPPLNALPAPSATDSAAEPPVAPSPGEASPDVSLATPALSAARTDAPTHSPAAAAGQSAGAPDLPAWADVAGPTESEPQGPTLGPGDSVATIRGRVFDAQTNAPLADARVSLDRAGDEPLVAQSDADGRYALAVPVLPDHVALSATHRGYLPRSIDLAAADVHAGRATADLSLERESDLVIAVEPDPRVHHLGNDRFEGAINSQFQRDSEGLRLRVEFQLAPDQVAPHVTAASIELLAKGVQCPHLLKLNGEELPRRMKESPADGSFGRFRCRFDPAILRPGTNVFVIRNVLCREDIDDFEFVNIRVRLKRGE
ncbi:MAG: carboxypeptidase regulatory-like domain-containing protein [Phycisphaerae bacterium]